MGIELELGGLRAGLPPGGPAFLAALAAELDEDSVRSVFLFGSAVRGEATEVSDLDLVLVLEEQVSDGEVAAVGRRCRRLAREHLDGAARAHSLLERILERQTGMFRTGFVTRIGAVENGEFHAIFDTSRLVYVVAPWRTVLASAFRSGVTVYGPDVAPDWRRIDDPRQRTGRELLRSLVTTLPLALFQLPYVLVSRRATSYSMEAAKWALYNCSFHAVPDGDVGLQTALRLVPDPLRFADRFLARRDDPRFDAALVLLAPIYVLFVHAWAAWTVLLRGRRGRPDCG